MLKLMILPFLLAASFAAAVLPTWEITEDYAVRFSTQRAEGTFTDLRGTVNFSPDDLLNASFDVSVATASIATGNKTKDKHARGKAWFDAEQHPRISFVSNRFTASETGYVVSGTMTIKGIAMPQTISFTFTPTADGGLFVGTTTINRADFDLDGPFLFGSLVGDEVAVDLRVPVE